MADGDWNFIVSCDMPFLTREWLTFLIGRALASSAQVVLAQSAAGPEPLCACRRTDTAEILRQALEKRCPQSDGRRRTAALGSS